MQVIDKKQLALHRAQGPWKQLEALALCLCSHVKTHGGESFSPVLGGGTRLMLALNHRISDDIDLFVDSPGWLGYVSPRLNDDYEDLFDSYQEESGFVKLRLVQGEIDFIVASDLLNHKDLWNPVAEDCAFTLSSPAEILAKKLYYRGWALTPRDLFDWYAVCHLAPQDAIPHKAMAWLLSSKLNDIQASLARFTHANNAIQFGWDKIRTPYPIDIQVAASWAKTQTSKYQEIVRHDDQQHPLSDDGNGNLPPKY